MVDKIVPRYMYQKDGTYYFSRHVPNDVRHHYACDRIVICIKTSSEYAANNASRSIAGKLDDYWMKLRLSEMTVPAAHLLVNGNNLFTKYYISIADSGEMDFNPRASPTAL